MISRTLVALAAASFAAAQTTLQVTSPNSATWWVAQSQNVFAWTCHASGAPQQFTVLLWNTDHNTFASPEAIVAQEPNADCSATLSPDQVNFPVGTGYVLQLANILNSSDLYAQSEPFEIKALGSTYPTTTPGLSSGSATATGGSSGSSTGTASSSASSSTSSGNSASKVSMGFGLGAVGAFLGLMTF